LPATTRGRVLTLAIVVGLALAAWRYQSKLIGMAAERYLTRVAAKDETRGEIGGRRQLLEQIHRRLLMPAPPEAFVPELFDFATVLSSRVANGDVSLNWAAYLYTAYWRELGQRPAGTPRRPKEELQATLDRQIEFFAIRKRPDVPGVRVGDLLGAGGDSISLEEIEAAEREGRELDLR
jgi:hypothetical protein